MVDVIQRDVPETAQLEAEIWGVGDGQGDDQRPVLGQIELARRGVLRGQPAGRESRRDHRVGRGVGVEPLGKL